MVALEELKTSPEVEVGLYIPNPGDKKNPFQVAAYTLQVYKEAGVQYLHIVKFGVHLYFRRKGYGRAAVDELIRTAATMKEFKEARIGYRGARPNSLGEFFAEGMARKGYWKRIQGEWNYGSTLAVQALPAEIERIREQRKKKQSEEGQKKLAAKKP